MQLRNVDSNELRFRVNSSTLPSQVVRYHNAHNGKQYHQNIFQYITVISEDWVTPKYKGNSLLHNEVNGNSMKSVRRQ